MNRAPLTLLPLLASLFAAAVLTTGCFARYINVENQDGRVEAIGPVFEREPGVYSVTIAIYDMQGDPVDVQMQWRQDGGTWQDLDACPTATLCSRSGLKGLSTSAREETVQHLLTLAGNDVNLHTLELRAWIEDETRAVTWPR